MRNVIRGRNAAAIAGSVEDAVQQGVFAAGHRLPPVRALAASLRVSPVTVAAAYRQLQRRGLVIASGRRGTRVTGTAQDGAAQAASALAGAMVRATVAADGTVDLTSGVPDLESLRPADVGLRLEHVYTDGGGGSTWLPAFAAFARDDFDADGVSANSITLCASGLDAIDRLLREELRPGDAVGVEDPGPPAVRELLASSGYVLEPVVIDDHGPVPDAVDLAITRGVRALIVTSRAQDPTGAALTAERARDLSRLLRDRDRLLLIEYDPAGPIAGRPFVTLSAATRRWAVVRPAALLLGPEFPLALVAGDALTIGRLNARAALADLRISLVLQQLALTRWADPATGRRLGRAADVHAARRDRLLDALSARGMQAHGRSGFNVWIPVAAEAAAVLALAQRGWAVAAGERFRLRSGPGIRITVSTLTAELTTRLADDVAAVVRSRP